MEKSPLHSRKILVVEDEGLVAMLIEDNLIDFGCEIVGIAASVNEALEMIQTYSGIDAAVLDMNLNGKSSEPIANLLVNQSIPFVFVTGYGDRERKGTQPVVSKPFTSESLRNGLLAILA